jgi:hypothetical protein
MAPHAKAEGEADADRKTHTGTAGAQRIVLNQAKHSSFQTSQGLEYA